MLNRLSLAQQRIKCEYDENDNMTEHYSVHYTFYPCCDKPQNQVFFNEFWIDDLYMRQIANAKAPITAATQCPEILKCADLSKRFFRFIPPPYQWSYQQYPSVVRWPMPA